MRSSPIRRHADQTPAFFRIAQSWLGFEWENATATKLLEFGVSSTGTFQGCLIEISY